MKMVKGGIRAPATGTSGGLPADESGVVLRALPMRTIMAREANLRFC
jgi:hypothetical protein